MAKQSKKTECKVNLNVDLTKFRDLSDDQIAARFNKMALPRIIKKLRQGARGRAEECNVCTPWSYSFF